MADMESAIGEKKSKEAESPTKKTQSLDADAFHNFLQGKRHLLVQDYAHAVDSLADACELYVKHYGETAAECGEVYYHYGLALFRLFQQQAGILGDVLPEGSEEDDDDDDDEEEEGNKSDSEEDKEKENTDSNSNNEGEGEADEEDLEDEDEDAKKEESNTDKNEAEPKVAPESLETKGEVSNNTIAGNKDASSDAEAVVVSSTKESIPSDSKESAKADSNITEATSTVADEKEQPGPSTSMDNAEAGPSTSQPKSKSEDVSDLQLAWETLETAKSIFKRNDDREAQLKVAEILLILAEISMELENYTSAVDDLQECLHVREHLLPPDDRSIAETYYQLALAYTYDSQVKPAIENYEKSMQVITLRIENLKNQTEIKKTPEGFDIDPQVEIDELEGLLPEIKAKMEDTQDMMQDARKVVKEMAFQKVEEMSSASSPEKPVTNISHLLKRKKPEDSDTVKPIEVKKIKLASTENGDAGPSEMLSAENSSPPKA